MQISISKFNNVTHYIDFLSQGCLSIGSTPGISEGPHNSFKYFKLHDRGRVAPITSSLVVSPARSLWCQIGIMISIAHLFKASGYTRT